MRPSGAQRCLAVCAEPRTVNFTDCSLRLPDSRCTLFRELTSEPPPESAWEVGASCNFMIAASRLGLRVGAVGHVGDDVYGDFMRRVLQVPYALQSPPSLSPVKKQTLRRTHGCCGSSSEETLQLAVELCSVPRLRFQCHSHTGPTV